MRLPCVGPASRRLKPAYSQRPIGKFTVCDRSSPAQISPNSLSAKSIKLDKFRLRITIKQRFPVFEVRLCILRRDGKAPGAGLKASILAW